jgi:hypothetical protein
MAHSRSWMAAGEWCGAGGFVGLACQASGMAQMSDRVAAALAERVLQQDHVITRRQAMACGMSDQMLKHRMRLGGPWQKLLPGVYLTPTGTPTPDQREMAALLYGGPGSVITGAAALRRQGLHPPDDGVVDVLIPARYRRGSAGFARIHRTTKLPGQVVVIRGRDYAMVARAVADAARIPANRPEVRALVASAVQARRCPLGLLAAELREGPVRDSASLHKALGEVADGVRSGAEGDLRDLIRRARLPAPMYNARLFVTGGALLAVPDAWWPDAGVAAEVDSREWHLSPADWQHTLARHAAMTAHGILLLHFTPGQIRAQPGEVAAAIRKALAAGGARPRLPIRTFPAAA